MPSYFRSGSAYLAPVTMGQPNVQGQWSTLSDNTGAPINLAINPVHVALLSNGEVLVVAGSGNCPPSQSGCHHGFTGNVTFGVSGLPSGATASFSALTARCWGLHAVDPKKPTAARHGYLNANRCHALAPEVCYQATDHDESSRFPAR
jgi:hypothetical protein